MLKTMIAMIIRITHYKCYRAERCGKRLRLNDSDCNRRNKENKNEKKKLITIKDDHNNDDKL